MITLAGHLDPPAVPRARCRGQVRKRMTLDQRARWTGTVLSVQPRIRLTRSFDERSHTYLGFDLRLRGRLGRAECEFVVAIGKAAHAKHGYQVRNVPSGESEPVPDPRLENASLYRSTRLRLLHLPELPSAPPPPRHDPPPNLETYRARGHRRLGAHTYESECLSYIWGCRMPVEMLIDPWDSTFKHRFETFCYGPKSCPLYRAGPTRKVPGRKGMVYEEEDWVDEGATSHRPPDE